MERRKESAIWRYFTVATPARSTAVCNICKTEVSRGGSSTATYNTTNLIKHLRKHHVKEHAEFEQATSSKGAGGTAQQQLTLSESLQRREKYPANSVKATKITEKIMECIVLDGEPLSLVERTGFRRLIEFLESRYTIPSRKYFTETALPELYKRVRDHIAKQIKDVTAMSFTTDIWSSDVCPISLLSLTVHWLDTSCTPHSAMLQAKNFHGSHTGETISAAIKQMLDQWRIPLCNVHVILTDNARNMKRAMAILGVRNLGCFAHTIQLVVDEGLLSQRSVSEVLACCRQIVGHFKHSNLAYSRLQDIQMQMQMEPKRLQQDVKTRWNSTYIMVQSLLEQKRALCAYIADHDDLPSTLTANQWALMEKTSIVLAPFEELTRKVSSSTASTADVIPAVTVLRRLLAREGDEDTGIKTMKRTLLQALERRFITLEDKPLYTYSTLLDPRYKDRYFTNPDTAKYAKEALLKELQEGDCRTTAITAEASEAAEPLEKAPRMETAAPSSKSSLMKEFDQILEESDDPGAATSSGPAVEQLHAYFAEKTIATSDNPYQYWGVNRQRVMDLGGSGTGTRHGAGTKRVDDPLAAPGTERGFIKEN
ncbi:zinc finger BED domain-containing protein 4-like [Paramormyrops kingsleyae]|uniref:zinc finger BED domain-containing protein 4-like n=1 Tax=Paramormyrops kingsleyae TaxID=1676925 RepID=UPI003B96B00A